jgi:hypothetical protein
MQLHNGEECLERKDGGSSPILDPRPSLLSGVSVMKLFFFVTNNGGVE